MDRRAVVVAPVFGMRSLPRAPTDLSAERRCVEVAWQSRGVDVPGLLCNQSGIPRLGPDGQDLSSTMKKQL